MTDRRQQAIAAFGAGVFLWGVAVLEPSLLPFFAWLVAGAGFAIGGMLGGNALLTGVLLGTPALLTAAWLTPRGDEDGLWLLVFPFVVFAMGCAAVAHVAGAAVARRKKPPDLRT